MSQLSRNLKRPASLRSLSAEPVTRTSIALGLSTAMLVPATTVLAAGEEQELKPVTVVERVIDHNPYAEPGAPYKARYSGDERRVKPLAETPATITVLTQQQLQDTGRTDLRDVLRAQPGITLGTGENGNAFGDRYIIRGQEARSDVFVDGLRDPGMTIRESFAVEQVEITKGPSATFAGRGATGGAVNAVTKQATTASDFTKISAGIGTDRYRRVTVDSNRVLSDNAALRVNLLDASQDVPDRAPTSRKRQGAALSLNLKPTRDFDITADYYHLEANDKPDLGSWYVNGSPVRNIPVYAQNEDFLKSTIDAFTVRLGYQISDTVRLTNLSRYGTTRNGYVVTSATGTTETNASLASHNGWQEVEYFANRTNLFIDQDLWGMKHQFVLGAEFSDQKVLNGSYNLVNTGASNCTVSRTTASGVTTSPGFCITDAAGNAVGNINTLLQRTISRGAFKSDWQTKTVSLSAMDTVDLTDKLTAFGGIRFDRFRYANLINSATDGANQYELNDTLFNAHLGLTYKFRPDANVYASYSTASDFNGGESDVTNCGYGGLCLVGNNVSEQKANFRNSKPEKSENLEIGTKWNLMGGKLLATAAAFQVTKRDVMENTTTTNYSLTGTMNTGQYKIHGVEFGLAGNLTERLSAYGGLAIMNSEVQKSAVEANIGRGLSNFPEKSASLLLNYQATPKFNFGGNLTYHGAKFSGSPETVEGRFTVPEYTVLDLFATYRIDKNLSARINIGNVTNEKYYLATYTSGKFTYLGDARNARLTLNYNF